MSPNPIRLVSIKRENGNLGKHRDMCVCTQSKDPVRRKQKGGHLQAKVGVLRQINPGGTLIWAF